MKPSELAPRPRVRGREPSFAATFRGGAAFAFGFAVVRFLMVA